VAYRKTRAKKPENAKIFPGKNAKILQKTLDPLPWCCKIGREIGGVPVSG
jgi:hypothetical protein